jgi:hypothetical protein
MISLAASTSPISPDLLLESAPDPLPRCGAWEQLKQLSDLSLWYGVLVVRLEYWQDLWR